MILWSEPMCSFSNKRRPGMQDRLQGFDGQWVMQKRSWPVAKQNRTGRRAVQVWGVHFTRSSTAASVITLVTNDIRDLEA